MLERRAAARILMAALVASSTRTEARVGVSTYEKTLSAGLREGAVVVWSTTDDTEAEGVVAGFRAHYPSVQVDHVKMISTDLYDRFLIDVAGRAGTADLLWSSAMDLQFKLVNDGYAQQYASPEADGLPSWAVWRDAAYGITVEPVAFAYNRRLLPDELVPVSHAALLQELVTNTQRWTGKIASYDPDRSGAGFLFLTQDVEVTSRTWELIRAMGQADVQLYTNTETMLNRVIEGRQLLAYNVLGSYAAERAKNEPSLGIVLPHDYTLLLSRIAFISNAARHPNAARLFLDYLLSREGQSRLAARSLTPVRPEARAGSSLSVLSPDVLRPIPVGPELLAYLDQIKRARFLSRWKRTLNGQ